MFVTAIRQAAHKRIPDRRTRRFRSDGRGKRGLYLGVAQHKSLLLLYFNCRKQPDPHSTLYLMRGG